MMESEGLIDDHSLCATIDEGVSTDLFARLVSNEGHSEHQRRGSDITNRPFGYRLRVYSV